MSLRLWPSILLGSALISPLAAPVALAAPEQDASRRQTIEFSANASQAAPNDLGIATLYVESNGKDAAALAKEINQRIAKALDLARGFASVKAQSGGVSTWPVYAKNGQGKIESWRMRSEIRIESRDLGALSELIGRLQSDLALSGVAIQPAPETRRKAEEEATVSAIQAFEQRAALIARTLGKQYRIVHMSIGDSGGLPPIRYRMQASAMMADAAHAPAPLEGGESELAVSINGRIELLD
ncbi:SIMPL domain-containing protein [Thauera sp.]|uniref:SIMPL domain-containing protein n=1 Tax=Thauera sp. TaxID=1905334 RepID=UPI0039E69053